MEPMSFPTTPFLAEDRTSGRILFACTTCNRIHEHLKFHYEDTDQGKACQLTETQVSLFMINKNVTKVIFYRV
eukprot:c19715_g1_i1 orf=17-235(-)